MILSLMFAVVHLGCRQICRQCSYDRSVFGGSQGLAKARDSQGSVSFRKILWQVTLGTTLPFTAGGLTAKLIDQQSSGCSYVCQGTETEGGRAPGSVRMR